MILIKEQAKNIHKELQGKTNDVNVYLPNSLSVLKNKYSTPSYIRDNNMESLLVNKDDTIEEIENKLKLL
jgi:hypothetical protein